MNTAGGRWVWITGQNFLPSVDSVTYGPEGEGYVPNMDNCTVFDSGTVLDCLSKPGTGHNHIWKIWTSGNANDLEDLCEQGMQHVLCKSSNYRLYSQDESYRGRVQVRLLVRNLGTEDPTVSV